MSCGLAALSERWSEWHRAMFPHSTPEAYALKMGKEALEFRESPSLEEGADVVLCLLGWLDLEGHSVYDLFDAIEAKIIKNMTRTWTRLPDGTYQHVG